MKIKITTNRAPWVNDKPQHEGVVIDADDDVANALIERGWAEAADKRAGKAKQND